MRVIKMIYFMLVITPLVLLLSVALWPVERELARKLISDAFGVGGGL